MAILPPMPRTHPEVERQIHAALEDARSKQHTPSNYVRLSSIGRCVRDLWAERHGIPDERPPEGRALMTFDVGHALEPQVVAWLNGAGYSVSRFDRYGNQFRVVMGEKLGVGHIDGMILWGRPSSNDWRLLEVKTAKASQFDKLEEAGLYDSWKPAYGDQIHAYMGASCETWAMPDLTQALVVVVCKDDARIHAEMVAFDPARYQQLVERARTALGPEMPDRPAKARGQYSAYCKWCSRAAWCYSPTTGIEFDE